MKIREIKKILLSELVSKSPILSSKEEKIRILSKDNRNNAKIIIDVYYNRLSRLLRSNKERLFEIINNIRPEIARNKTSLYLYTVLMDSKRRNVLSTKLELFPQRKNNLHLSNTKLEIPLPMHEVDGVSFSLTARVKTTASAMINQLGLDDPNYIPDEGFGVMILCPTSENVRQFVSRVIPKMFPLTQFPRLKDIDFLGDTVVNKVPFAMQRSDLADFRIRILTLLDKKTNQPFEVQMYTLLPDNKEQSAGGWAVTRFTSKPVAYGIYKVGTSVQKARINLARVIGLPTSEIAFDDAPESSFKRKLSDNASSSFFWHDIKLRARIAQLYRPDIKYSLPVNLLFKNLLSVITPEYFTVSNNKVEIIVL